MSHFWFRLVIKMERKGGREEERREETGRKGVEERWGEEISKT